MLEIGVPPGLHKGEVALTPTESRAHFGAWCIVSSPLVLGLDVRDGAVLDAVWPVISNTEALAVNRAWAGSAGVRVAAATTTVAFPSCGSQYKSGCSIEAWEVFAKPLPGGGAALLLLNHNDAGAPPLPLSIDLAAVAGLRCAGGCAVRDVWAHAALAPVTDSFAASVKGHDSVFVVLTPSGAEV